MFLAQLRGARNLRGHFALRKPKPRRISHASARYRPEPGIEPLALPLAAKAGLVPADGFLGAGPARNFPPALREVEAGWRGGGGGGASTGVAGGVALGTAATATGSGSVVVVAGREGGAVGSSAGAGRAAATRGAGSVEPIRCSDTAPAAASAMATAPAIGKAMARRGGLALGGVSGPLGTTGGGVRLGASPSVEGSGTNVRVGPGSVSGPAPGANGTTLSISVRTGDEAGTAVGA